MGLETLLEAAYYLEYKAEVEARGEQGLTDLPRNSTSSASSSSSSQNGYENRAAIIPNGLRLFVPETPFRPSSAISPTVLPRVPESVNGFKISDHSYRRIHQLSHSPTFDFNGGTNRISKNSSFSLNNRNSGTREVHNKLEKNRRAHLKECFELLKSQLPAFEDRKISNLAILRSSLRHIQALKRRERDYEYEMERLAREKITLQQRLSTLKKDVLGKWDHLDWRAVVPEDVDVDFDTSSGPSTDTVFSENHGDSLRSSESEEPNSPPHMMEPIQNEESRGANDTADFQHPLTLTVNNCHIGEKSNVKRIYGVNGVNGISSSGPISLKATIRQDNTKLSSSPLAAITVEKKASSPTGGATCVNNMANNSGKGLSSSLLNNATMVVTSKLDVGQYYEEKMCK